MDTITHALGGALLSQATTSNKNSLSLRARFITGFIAAAFPDIDIIARFFGMLTYLDMHRGITHSLLLIPFWALLLSVVFSKLSLSRFSNNNYKWHDFYFIACIGITSHIVGDIITAYGTMIFAPLSNVKFAWPTTFIIDFYFSGIIIVTLIVMIFFRNKFKEIAITGLIVLVTYVLYQATLNNQATKIAKEYIKANNILATEIFTMPQPLSPYHWKIIIKTADGYKISYINLLNKEAENPNIDASLFERIRSLYQPIGSNKWLSVKKFGEQKPQLVQQVWSMDIMSSVREFMMFPSLKPESNQSNCIWFEDHRFILGSIRVSPFIFGMCKTNSNWKLYRLSGDTVIAM